jgi:iron complex transport system substrate-binding protein
MKPPERIVSLISSATEILYLLALGKRVMGVSHECDYPRDVLSKPRLTRSLVDACSTSRAIDESVRSLASSQSALYTIDVEGLAALEPDLIVTQAQCDVCAVRYQDVVSAVRSTPKLAGAQILALNPQSLADVLDDVTRVGRATGAEAAAQDARAALESRIRAARAKAAQLPPGDILRVVCLEWIDPPMVAANWMPELVAGAGGEPGLTASGRHSTYAEWQDIRQYDPQVLVIMPCGFGLERAIEESQVLPHLPGWSELSAVRDGRVFAADGNAYFNRSGPRLVDSMEILGQLFHPALYPLQLAEPQQAWRRLLTRGAALAPL